jgi:hypothetical protein
MQCGVSQQVELSAQIKASLLGFMEHFVEVARGN